MSKFCVYGSAGRHYATINTARTIQERMRMEDAVTVVRIQDESRKWDAALLKSSSEF